jgi:hypothetical protein
MRKLDLERVAPGATKLHFMGGIIRWRSARTRPAKLETAVWTAVRSHEGRGVLAIAKMVHIAVMVAYAVEQCCSVVHQSAGRGQHLAGWTDVDIAFLIIVEVSARERE